MCVGGTMPHPTHPAGSSHHRLPQDMAQNTTSIPSSCRRRFHFGLCPYDFGRLSLRNFGGYASSWATVTLPSFSPDLHGTSVIHSIYALPNTGTRARPSRICFHRGCSIPSGVCGLLALSSQLPCQFGRQLPGVNHGAGSNRGEGSSTSPPAAPGIHGSSSSPPSP
jgi:hypothetical protein